MTTLVVGMVASPDGLAQTSDVEPTASGRGAVEYRQFHKSQALEYRSSQPSRIPVDFDHTGGEIGEVCYLAQRGSGLFAVCELDDAAVDALPSPFYLSAELEGHFEHGVYTDITLNRVGIVAGQRPSANSPALVIRGDIETAHCYWNAPSRPLLREAGAYAQERRYRAPQPHHIGGLPETVEPRVEELGSGAVIVDGELALQRGGGRRIALPGGGFGEIEFSAHRGPVISVT